MDFKSRIVSLDLPDGSFLVVGSGVLQALGLRASSDIDMILTQEAFDQLKKEPGWEYTKWGEHEVLRKDEFDFGTEWGTDRIDALLLRAMYIAGIPYLSLQDLRTWKLNRGSSKDLRDIELIDTYLSTHTA